MNPKPKCIWTGERDSRAIPVELNTVDRLSFPSEKTFYVLPEYEQKLRDFNKRLIKNGRLFLTLIIGLTLFLPFIALIGMAFSFSGSIILISVGIITSLIGVVIILFPFATPETVKWIGLKKAITTARVTGIFTVLLGIAFCFLILV